MAGASDRRSSARTPGPSDAARNKAPALGCQHAFFLGNTERCVAAAAGASLLPRLCHTPPAAHLPWPSFTVSLKPLPAQTGTEEVGAASKQ